MVQAQFPDGKPGPAKAVIFRKQGSRWVPETVEDPDSNVWHKGLPWRGGLLTIGAQRALLKHWTRSEGKWSAKTLWEASFGGKFDRFRDVEVADLDGDGAEEIAIATHDMGVVAVGDENPDGSWTFQEFDKAPDTFVHEVEVGDVDGDGKVEFYVTPSARNKASGVSQPGGVVRYDHQDDGSYKRTPVVSWSESHAKEILVTDLMGDKHPELYVAKEGHVVKEDGKKVLKQPAQIVRMEPNGRGGYNEVVVAELPGEKQCRFLVAGDVNGDGQEGPGGGGLPNWVVVAGWRQGGACSRVQGFRRLRARDPHRRPGRQREARDLRGLREEGIPLVAGVHPQRARLGHRDCGADSGTPHHLESPGCDAVAVEQPPNYITPYGYEIMRRELEWLDHEERPRVVSEVSYAASLGDRSENAEYIYGKKRLRQIDSRRRFLVKRLEKARLVDPADMSGTTVRFGATVVIADEEGEERTWRIYGEDEVDVQAGILSWRSPLANALMGKEEGDGVRFRAPSGQREVEIVEVRYEPCPPVPEDLTFNR